MQGVQHMLMHAIAVVTTFLAALSGHVNYGREVVAFNILHITPPHAQVIFVGDMMFDRSVRESSAKHGDDYLFSCIDPSFEGADVVMGNLEGPITASSSVSLGSKPGSSKNFTFTFATSTAALLARHNVRLVSLGNNHILNFKESGLQQTKGLLTEAGVGYFGAPDTPQSDRVYRTNVNGVPFSFVNWSDWAGDATSTAIAQVREEAKSNRVVVVYAHWGDEYVAPPVRVKILAHAFVDAGANIVIGSHPHVVLEKDFYNGAHVYYSLGNFIFDQFMNDAVDHGLAVAVTFSRNGVIGVKEIPVTIGHDRRVCPTGT